MSIPLRYAVIGTGAIGGYFGGRLAQAGSDVHFLLRSDYERVKQNGLVVESVDGDFTLAKVNAYNHPADMPPVDVVLIALKTTNNHKIAELLPPLKPGSAIVCLQNGWGIESAIAQHLKEHIKEQELTLEIIGGLCFIYANKPKPGYIQHFGYGKLMLGAHNEQGLTCSITPRIEAIAADFRAANIAVETTEDLPMARWRKLVWNVPYNGLSVVLNATTGEMMANSEVRSLIETLMQEVVTLANAWGDRQATDGSQRHLPPELIQQMLSITAEVPAYDTSMKVDYDRQQPLEIEEILGNPLRVASELNIAVPAMTMVYQQLSFLNGRLETR